MVYVCVLGWCSSVLIEKGKITYTVCLQGKSLKKKKSDAKFIISNDNWVNIA